jgi:hypothetical protein
MSGTWLDDIIICCQRPWLFRFLGCTLAHAGLDHAVQIPFSHPFARDAGTHSGMRPSRGLLAALGAIPLVFLALVFLALVLCEPAGMGSERRCKVLKHDLLGKSIADLKSEYGSELNIITCDGGDIIGICEDSHSSWFGGSMAVKLSDTEVVIYMGHVCGDGFLKHYLDIFRAERGYQEGPVKMDELSERAVIFTRLRVACAERCHTTSARHPPFNCPRRPSPGPAPRIPG